MAQRSFFPSSIFHPRLDLGAFPEFSFAIPLHFQNHPAEYAPLNPAGMIEINADSHRGD
jgi:hypothetical protein